MKLATERLTRSTIYVLAHPRPPRLCSLYDCSPDQVVFMTSRDQYEPYYVDDRKYFELATFYDELTKDWQQRRLPMYYDPRDEAVEVYRFWCERNGGERRVGGA